MARVGMPRGEPLPMLLTHRRAASPRLVHSRPLLCIVAGRERPRPASCSKISPAGSAAHGREVAQAVEVVDFDQLVEDVKLARDPALVR
jgi:hypothetical protein